MHPQNGLAAGRRGLVVVESIIKASGDKLLFNGLQARRTLRVGAAHLMLQK
jgi:hypothetical protein